MTSPARHAGIARSITEADDQFARVLFGSARARTAEAPRSKAIQDRKDNDMIAALVVAWFAVVGLVLIARADYGRRPLTR